MPRSIGTHDADGQRDEDDDRDDEDDEAGDNCGGHGGTPWWVAGALLGVKAEGRAWEDGRSGGGRTEDSVR